MSLDVHEIRCTQREIYLPTNVYNMKRSRRYVGIMIAFVNSITGHRLGGNCRLLSANETIRLFKCNDGVRPKHS